MHRSTLLAVLALTVVHCHAAVQQLQMPVAAELQQPDDDLQAQIKELQKNVSDIWSYIYDLRNAVSHHLTHLRQHQVELESSMHKMEHLHESDVQSVGHHHSGEQHSHSGEQHSHSGEQHSHSGEQHSHSGEHSHGDDHSHGSMEGHSHSGEHHSHGDDHSHSGEHHSHSGEHGHHSYSYSHSHTSHDHSKEDSHSHDDHHHHGHDHKNSHETEDLSQQTQQVAQPVAEPIVTATNRQEHHHHHHQSQATRSGSDDSMNLLNEHSFHHHHHHDHHHDSRSRNRTVELPRYSDYGLYDLATCSVSPNRAIPDEQQQNVVGTVTMWQKKTGGPLNFHVRLQGFDVGDHHGHHQQVQQEEDNETPQPVGHRHGFHIHAFGDLSNGCQSAGPHYNPKGVNHGGPSSLVRHVGDLGNIECDEHGYANILFSDDVASLGGQYSVIGKAIVIHALEDDLGLGGNAESLKTGNAGTRLACCVIQRVDKIPLRQYKAMKAATHYKNH